MTSDELINNLEDERHAEVMHSLSHPSRPFAHFLTHSGCFHADDVLATAIARWHHELHFPATPQPEVIRTRDPQVVGAALNRPDVLVFDVGAQLNNALNNFDHHQAPPPPSRANGVPFSSCGLVWHHLGHAICSAVVDSSQDALALHAAVDVALIQFVDALDNGVAHVDAYMPAGKQPLTCCHFSSVVAAYCPSAGDAQQFTAAFEQAAAMAGVILRSTVLSAAQLQHVQRAIDAQAASPILYLEEAYPWDKADFSRSQALFAVQPSPADHTWQVQQVPVAPGSFVGRRALNPAWHGLSGQAFIAASGVPDAVFCHRTGFIAKALSSAGALALAEASIPKPPSTDSLPDILGFFGQYRWLSNFFATPVPFEGLTYPSSEAAFQAAKRPPAEREPFTRMTPAQAKKAGRTGTLPKDWEARRLQVMWTVLIGKFETHPHLRNLLLSTGDTYLEETNTWGDCYWGVCRGRGTNYLGRLLMALRTQLTAGHVTSELPTSLPALRSSGQEEFRLTP